jgi:hypothetical protein
MLQPKAPTSPTIELFSIIQLNVSKMLGNTPLVGVKTVICHTNGGYMSGEVYMPTVKTKMNSLVQMAGVSITYLSTLWNPECTRTQHNR